MTEEEKQIIKALREATKAILAYAENPHDESKSAEQQQTMHELAKRSGKRF